MSNGNALSINRADTTRQPNKNITKTTWPNTAQCPLVIAAYGLEVWGTGVLIIR
ncbi:hypothetical protein [Methylomonas sp. CM2]|uniref:hypothetical protein n=1 Tax=Methylomonas sp. CM2 TaxID=3417647 RepID=UPI003CF4E344